MRPRGKKMTYEIGQEIKIIDDINRYGESRSAKVTRLTKSQVTVIDNGNERKFWLTNGRMIGYAWPTLTLRIE